MAMKMMMMMTMLLVILLMMMTKMTSRVWWLPLSWCMTLIKKTKEEKKVLPTVSFFGAISIYIGYIHFSIVESRATGASGTFSLSW